MIRVIQLIDRSVNALQEIVNFSECSGRAVLCDFTVCPRSVSLVRLLFRNECGIDIRFASQEHVVIEGQRKP
jgi:hypothetical protein